MVLFYYQITETNENAGGVYNHKNSYNWEIIEILASTDFIGTEKWSKSLI